MFLTLFFSFLVARLGKELSAFLFSISWLTYDSPIHCNLTTASTIPFGLTQQSRVIWIQTLAQSFTWCVILDKLLKSLSISFLLYKKGWYPCSGVMVKFSNQFSCSVMSDSLWPHELQHARLPCPSPTRRAYSNSCQWCHPIISSSVIPFSSDTWMLLLFHDSKLLGSRNHILRAQAFWCSFLALAFW